MVRGPHAHGLEAEREGGVSEACCVLRAGRAIGDFSWETFSRTLDAVDHAETE